MHTYIHASMHACMHTYMHAYIHTCMHTCIHACMHTYIHTHIHTYIHTYIHMHTYIHTYINTSIIHTCIYYTYIHILYIHTYIRTYGFVHKKICRLSLRGLQGTLLTSWTPRSRGIRISIWMFAYLNNLKMMIWWCDDVMMWWSDDDVMMCSVFALDLLLTMIVIPLVEFVSDSWNWCVWSFGHFRDMRHIRDI